MNTPVIGGIYKHFKGFTVKVISLAKHTETGEILVVYKCTEHPKESAHEDGIYARPLEMFMSEVDHEKYPDVKQKYRFQLVDNKSKNRVSAEKAKWEINSDGYYPYCSKCGNEPQNRVMTDFCPNCGCYMK